MAKMAKMAADTDSGQSVDQSRPSEESKKPSRYLTKWRLTLAMFGLSLSLFLPSMEVSIVSTSLITISKDLDGSSQSSWVITSYLLTLTSLLIIWAKLSDLVGVKSTLLTSMFLFIAFSGGCGAAQSMDQLIVNRALQGIGGSGVSSLALISFIQIVPPHKYSLVSVIASSVMSLALILGPLIGGIINENGFWRWAFLINVPFGAVCFIIIALALPKNFPYHCDDNRPFRLGILRKIDGFGALLLLGATVLLVTALSEGEVRFAWDSSIIITLFTVSGVLWICFIVWEWFASRSDWSVEPMFPWRFFSNRVWMGVLMGSLLTGATITIAVIELPQRFQIVNGNTPFQAGVKLLAYAAASPVGAIMSTNFTGRFRVPFIYGLIAGAVLQTVGFALLSTVPTTIDVWPGQYGYSVLAGLGTGASIGTQYIMAPLVVDPQDKHVAMGTVIQLRMLGSALGIAVANSVLNTYVRSHAAEALSTAQSDSISTISGNLADFPPAESEALRHIFGDGYNLQMRAAIAFCGAQFLSILLMWKKKPLRISDMTDVTEQG